MSHESHHGSHGSQGSGPEGMWRHQEARAHLAGAFWTMAGGRPGWRVADVGCGPGLFSMLYAGLTGPTGLVHAVDVDAEALAFLRAHLDPVHHAHVTTEELDITRAPLPDLHFHALFCTAALHHIEPLDDALRQLRAARAPLIIAEFDPEGPGEVGPPRDMRLGKRELEETLRRCGWSPEPPRDVGEETYVIVAR